eukprot:1781911-Alexandrium_andersonii.AAC.1
MGVPGERSPSLEESAADDVDELSPLREVGESDQRRGGERLPSGRPGGDARGQGAPRSRPPLDDPCWLGTAAAARRTRVRSA